MNRRRPSRQELAEAVDRQVPDLIADRLDVLFCGINPGLYTAAVGHHFARPGNRFWKALHGAGFTEELIDPFEERRLLEVGIGITNLVTRASAVASELSRDELRAGVGELASKLRRYRPRFLAVLGMSAFRTGFQRPRAVIGEQPELLEEARVWLLPNPSGLQARYQLAEITAAFAELREATTHRGPAPL